ncbi:LuxR C-terminal-related transcriptional regulator [Pseudomonas sp. BN415]|uniref:LuxR C-terminal-related transcriptional regulator n=1 Tax=Pseudomonas sp. BN415 TaxID=2567889 RepID=UPI002456E666|nr:LuxR C-terminal-related transcriptional regulator [Pseudomonas sp. BN415]
MSLLSAPLGYGKSILMAQYAAGLKGPWAWLRCATADNQPHVFLAHLAAALGISPEPSAASEEALWGVIVNNLEQRTERFTLFLDDLHHLRARGTCGYLNELLEFGPSTLHLVGASQGLPALAISQLRRDQRLQLLGAADLSLDSAQIEALAQARGLSLGADAIYWLRASSEGWISAVLLGLAAYAEEPGFSPERIKARMTTHVASFLEESLLADLPVELVRFIECTSVVGSFDERLAAQLSDNARADEAIRRLQRRDLLTSQRPDERPTYRYHPAVRGTGYLRLQGRPPEVLQTLHRKAADWLLDNRRYAEAVQQLGRAREYNRLLAVVEQHSFDLLRQGRIGSIVDFLAVLPEQDSDHLTLAITEASTVIATNDIARARNCLLRLQRLLRSETAPLHRPERSYQTVAFLRSRLAVLGGNFNHGLRLVTEALQQYPQQNAASAVLQFNQASCLFALGRSEEAHRCATAALEELTTLGFRGYTNSLHLLLVQIELSRGQLAEAEQRFLGLAQELPVSVPQNFYDLYLHLGQGLVLLQRNQFEAAAQRLAQAEALALDVVHCAALPWVLHHQACLAEARGDVEQARRRWDEARRLARHYQLFGLYRLAGAGRVQLAVGEHDEEFILAWLEEWHWCRRHYAEVMPEEHLAYAWVQRHLGQHEVAARIADESLRHALVEGNLLLQLQWHLLEATLHLDLKRRTEMEASLEQALQLAVRYGFGQLLHREGRGLREELRQLFNPQHRRQTGLEPLPPREQLTTWLPGLLAGEGVHEMLVEPLTRREQDVLRRMARGQGNQQIAEGLFIGLSTVKTHINKLFRKLDATDRETALQAARRLKFLDH